MTEQELKSLKFKQSVFAQLQDGGHMQMQTNDLHGIHIIHQKDNRRSQWRTFYRIGPHRGNSEIPTITALVDAVKDMEFLGHGEPPPAEPPTFAEAGKALRRKRLLAYLSIREMSAKTGIKPVRISNIEVGTEEATPEEVAAYGLHGGSE